jgi:uncharacterized lipoprotein YbaY
VCEAPPCPAEHARARLLAALASMRVLQLHTCATRSAHLHAAQVGEQLNRLVVEAVDEEKNAPVRGSVLLGTCVALPADARMLAKFCNSSTCACRPSKQALASAILL